MDDDQFTLTEDCLMEADQGPEVTLKIAKDNLAKLLHGAREHRLAIEQLRRDYADGKLDLHAVERELDNRDELLKKLDRRLTIFTQMVRDLEAKSVTTS